MDQRIEKSEEIMTEIIQQAVDLCEKTGGGRVILPPGMYVCGTLCLKDHVMLWLEEGAVLLGRDVYKRQLLNPSYGIFNTIIKSLGGNGVQWLSLIHI